MDELTPTTELEAVNAMLATIGEAPVNTLDATGLDDASEAYKRLLLSSRAVQARGWYWNTDYELRLSPTGDGTIALPANWLKVKTSKCDTHRRLVPRAGKLYDPKAHSFTFTGPVTVDLVSILDFEGLPEVARQSIFISAARVFQQQWVGSDTLNQFTAVNEQQAWGALVSDDIENSKLNMLTGSASVREAISR